MPERETELLAVAVLDCDIELLLVALRVAVTLDDGVPVSLPVALRVPVTMAVTLDDGVPVSLSVALRVPLTMAVTLDDGVPVSLPVALRVRRPGNN